MPCKLGKRQSMRTRSTTTRPPSTTPNRQEYLHIDSCLRPHVKSARSHARTHSRANKMCNAVAMFVPLKRCSSAVLPAQQAYFHFHQMLATSSKWLADKVFKALKVHHPCQVARNLLMSCLGKRNLSNVETLGLSFEDP